LRGAMPPMERSPGPLPSGSAFNAVSKDALLKAFYQTTSQREVPGRAPSAACVGENYIDVHSIGKRKTKYLEFQLSRSPLTTREACKYTKDFVPLPLGDNAINTAMAASFKGGLNAGKAALDVAMDGTTKYEDDFNQFLVADMVWAKQQSSKPPRELTNTLAGCGQLMETKSHEQTLFRQPNLALAKAERAAQPRPGLDIGGAARAAPRYTVDKREYAIAAAVARSMPRSLSTPAIDRAGFPPLHKDPEVFRVKRTPFMMPGK